MTQAVATRDDQKAQKKKREAERKRMISLVERYQPRLQAVLPSHWTIDQFVQGIKLAMYNEPKLYQADPGSLMQAFMEAAKLGLDPSGSLGSAHIVPFWNKKKGCYDAELIVGYKGYIDLARRSGEIEDIAAHVVYHGDEFDMDLVRAEEIVHKPDFEAERKKDNARLVYGIAWLKDTDKPHVDWMSFDEIEQIRRKYGSGKAWNDQYTWTEQARKTMIRRLIKQLPLSTEINVAANLEDAHARGQAVDADALEVSWEVRPEAEIAPAQKSQGTAKLKEKLVDRGDNGTPSAPAEPETNPDWPDNHIKRIRSEIDLADSLEELREVKEKVRGLPDEHKFELSKHYSERRAELKAEQQHAQSEQDDEELSAAELKDRAKEIEKEIGWDAVLEVRSSIKLDYDGDITSSRHRSGTIEEYIEALQDYDAEAEAEDNSEPDLEDLYGRLMDADTLHEVKDIKREGRKVSDPEAREQLMSDIEKTRSAIQRNGNAKLKDRLSEPFGK